MVIMLKKIITIYFLLSGFYSNCQNGSLSVGKDYCQTASNTNQNLLDNDHQKDYSLVSSNKLSKIETKLLGAGLTSVIFPLAISESDKYKGSYGFDATSLGFLFVGVLSFIISILYLISAKNNKKKAIELTLLPNFTNSKSELCINVSS